MSRRFFGFILLLSALFLFRTIQCDAEELRYDASDHLIVRALSFPEDGLAERDGRIYRIENGIIYKMIGGKRFKARCRDQAMEAIIPRAVVPGMFNIGSFEVKSNFTPFMKRLGYALSQGELSNAIIKIVGYSDSTGSGTYNLWLSQQRAISIATFLVKNCGISRERIHTDGRGEEQPIDSNKTIKGRSRNRRIEIHLTGLDGRLFPIVCQ